MEAIPGTQISLQLNINSCNTHTASTTITKGHGAHVYLNRQKKKAFDKTLHIFLIQEFNKLGTEQNFCDLIKRMYLKTHTHTHNNNKPQLTSYLKGHAQHAFPLRRRLLSPQFHTVLGKVLSRAIRLRK